MENAIPVRISSRRGKKSRQIPLHSHRNLSRVNVTGQRPSKPKQIPQCLVLNARSIVKPDAYPGYMRNSRATILMFAASQKHG